MKSLIYTLVLLTLLCEPCWTWLFSKDKVKLEDVRSLTFYSGQMTTGERASPIPQIRCIGGSAGCYAYVFDSVTCYNRGTDGYFGVQWECHADLASDYKFGNVAVSCEGYDYAEDPYVLRSSCGLEYTLDLVNGGWITTDTIVLFIISILFLIIIGSLLFCDSSKDTKKETQNTQGQGARTTTGNNLSPSNNPGNNTQIYNFTLDQQHPNITPTNPQVPHTPRATANPVNHANLGGTSANQPNTQTSANATKSGTNVNVTINQFQEPMRVLTATPRDINNNEFMDGLVIGRLLGKTIGHSCCSAPIYPRTIPASVQAITAPTIKKTIATGRTKRR